MASQTYINALKSQSRQPIYKIEWMNSDEQVISEITSDLIDGSISVELQNGIRRSCNIQLQNKDGLYLPNKDGLIYLNKKFKIYTGLRVDGVNYYNSQGIFNCANPVVRVSTNENTMQIEGYDNFSLLNGNISGELETDYIIPVDTSISEAVTSIFSLANIPKSPVIYPNLEAVPYTMTEQAGSNYAEILIKLAEFISYNIYFDIEGRPVFKPSIDEQIGPVVWEFLTSEPIYLGGDHNYDFLGVKNSIIVYGENIDGSLVKGVAEDTGVFSPTSISRIGTRTKVITDNLIYSEDLANDRAGYELKKIIQIYENFDMKCVPIDIIKEGDIVLVNDISAGFNRDRCLVRKIDIPLKFNSEQTLNIWKIVDTGV